MNVLLERDACGSDASRAACMVEGAAALAAQGSGLDGFTAQVYAPDGRRVTAHVRLGDGLTDCDGTVPVFCEAALGGCAELYASEQGAAQLEAVLRRAVCGWRSVAGDPAPALALRPLRPNECGLVRGVYALAAQARQCPVRATRAIWDALMERWRVLGLRAYVVEQHGKAVGYALLGAPEAADGESMYAALYEYAALPDGGPGLCEALAAGCEAGICAPCGFVLGSSLECVMPG